MICLLYLTILQSCNFTLFVPRNSERVASPRPLNIGAKKGKVGVGGRKHPIQKLTFQQSTLQCCHHPMTQCHSNPLQFILDEAPNHHPSHQLYARCHHPWKAYIQCFKKLIFVWLAIRNGYRSPNLVYMDSSTVVIKCKVAWILFKLIEC